MASNDPTDNLDELRRREEAAGSDSGADNADINEAEQNPRDTDTGFKYVDTPLEVAGRFKGLKKYGPVGALLTLVVGAGLGMNAFFAPSLLIIHMKEIMVDRFNTSLLSSEARSSKLINAKADSATAGLCARGITIKCRFSTMSSTQVAAFRNAGITVLPETPNAGGGRVKPDAYVWKGQEIRAIDFERVSQSDPSFKRALRVAYNPRFALFHGPAWSGTSAKLGTSKRPVVITGDTDAERQASLDESVRSPAATTDIDPARVAQICAGEADPDDCQRQRTADADANARATTADADASTKVSQALSTNPTDALGRVVNITGAVDSYCQAYNSIRAIGYAGKAIRAVQLARWAMAFMSLADEIKATGNVSPERMAFMGGILTEVTYDVAQTSRQIIRGSATDSFGYKFAAFGDTTGPTRSMNIASRFIAGGGFAGDLQNLSNTVLEFFPGGKDSARETCKVLANPVVQGGSFVLGAAFLFVPGAGQAKILGQIALGAGVQLGIALLPSLLAEIVAGTITEGVKGEEAGNVYASGAGKIMSDTLAGEAGNGLMTPGDAAVYLGENNRLLAQFKADEATDLSPFDPTHGNTFLGSIVSTLIPNLYSSNNGGRVLQSVAGIVTSGFASMIPESQAMAESNLADSLGICNDLDVIEIGYAADPFCNVIRGIPTQYLNKNPLQVIDELIASGLMDDKGVRSSSYNKFIDECITSDQPPGYGGAEIDFDPAKGKECIIDSGNVNMYLHYQDSQIQDTMDGLLTAQADDLEKQALAQKIVDKNKITYLASTEPVPTIEDIANGTYDGDSRPCGININILKAIDAITDKHSIQISSISRLCSGRLAGAGVNSSHYAGNGSALDISAVDGRATTGRDAGALSVIEIISPILTEAALSSGGTSRIGQSQCGPKVQPGAGIRVFQDACHHLHFDVPPKSDPNLEYLFNGNPVDPIGGINAV